MNTLQTGMLQTEIKSRLLERLTFHSIGGNSAQSLGALLDVIAHGFRHPFFVVVDVFA